MHPLHHTIALPHVFRAVLLYKIPLVVIGENTTLMGAEDLLEANGVEVINLGLDECREVLEEYIKDNPEIWDPGTGASGRIYGFGRISFFIILFFNEICLELNLCTIYTKFYNKIIFICCPYF